MTEDSIPYGKLNELLSSVTFFLQLLVIRGMVVAASFPIEYMGEGCNRSPIVIHRHRGGRSAGNWSKN